MVFFFISNKALNLAHMLGLWAITQYECLLLLFFFNLGELKMEIRISTIDIENFKFCQTKTTFMK